MESREDIPENANLLYNQYRYLGGNLPFEEFVPMMDIVTEEAEHLLYLFKQRIETETDPNVKVARIMSAVAVFSSIPSVVEFNRKLYGLSENDSCSVLTAENHQQVMAGITTFIEQTAL